MATSDEARTAIKHVQRLRNRLQRLVIETEQELRSVESYQNSGLSPEGLTERRKALAAEIRADARSEARRLQRGMDRHTKTITAFAERRLPKVAADAPAQVRLGQAWDRVRMMLEADRSWHDVLKVADTDMALALRTYGPAWYNSRPSEDWEPADLRAFNNTIDHRLGKMLGGYAEKAVEYSRELAGTKAWWDTTAEYFSRATGEPGFDMVGDSQRLHAIVSAKFDEQDAVALWPTPDQGSPASVDRFAPVPNLEVPAATPASEVQF